MAVVKLTTDNFEQEVMQADQPVLVDFYAEAGVKVCKINIDEQIELAQRYGVMSIPTFISFKNGEVSGKQVGAVPKSRLLELVK